MTHIYYYFYELTIFPDGRIGWNELLICETECCRSIIRVRRLPMVPISEP